MRQTYIFNHYCAQLQSNQCEQTTENLGSSLPDCLQKQVAQLSKGQEECPACLRNILDKISWLISSQTQLGTNRQLLLRENCSFMRFWRTPISIESNIFLRTVGIEWLPRYDLSTHVEIIVSTYMSGSQPTTQTNKQTVSDF